MRPPPDVFAVLPSHGAEKRPPGDRAAARGGGRVVDFGARTRYDVSAMVPHPPTTGGSRRGLVFGLAVIATIFIVQALVAGVRTRRSEARVRLLYADSLASIEQVMRIGRHIDQSRILLDDYIFEKQTVGTALVEQRLAEVAADLRRAQDTYAPLVELPNEAATWRQAQALLVRFERAMAEVLDLLRTNRDAAARARMTAVLADYADLNRTIEELVRINRVGAAEAMARIHAIQQSNDRALQSTWIAGLFALALFGWWGIRRIAAYEARLIAYSRLLEARNTELDAFAGRIAHDLRGPLGSITLTTGLLSETAAADQLAAVDRMRRAAARIQAMIDDLLTLSRLDAQAEGECCNPAVVAAKIREDFTERFGAHATLRHEAEAATVRCGEGLLRQALWNLVENGVKYRRDTGRAEITISGHATAAGYELRVSDTGIGMSPEEAARAFEPFYRAGRVQQAGGTGLGLSIVKRIVEASGGSVSITSRLGQGTTFVLQLPRAGGGSAP